MDKSNLKKRHEAKVIPTKVRLFGYNPAEFAELELTQLDSLESLKKQWTVLWVAVEGLADQGLLNKLGSIFGLHQLALEDVVNTNQRPKVDEYEGNIYIALRVVRSPEKFDTQQLSIFLGNKFVITFQENSGLNSVEQVLEKIRKGYANTRKLGADYLVYLLLDAAVDEYFPVLESYGEKLDSLENQIIENPSRKLVVTVHGIKRDFLLIRRAIWPMREALNSLIRDGATQTSDEVRVYLRDCYDHIVRLMDFVETYRELASDLMDIYLSSLSNRMNEIMKVLTIITTIFMPSAFIASIYGMNFRPDNSPYNMPELNWKYGYFYALFLMLITTMAMVWYLYWKGWIGSKKDDGLS